MNLMILRFAKLTSMALMALVPVLAQGQDRDSRPLASYEGTWDCEFKIDSTDGTEPRIFNGVVEAKWVLDDKFLEQTGKYRLGENSKPLIIKTMMSFDRTEKRFQYDYFNSFGEIHRSFGQWDKNKKTMTSTRTDKNGNTSTINANFSTPDVETWSIETTDHNGKRLSRIYGTNTRRKDN